MVHGCSPAHATRGWVPTAAAAVFNPPPCATPAQVTAAGAPARHSHPAAAAPAAAAAERVVPGLEVGEGGAGPGVHLGPLRRGLATPRGEGGVLVGEGLEPGREALHLRAPPQRQRGGVASDGRTWVAG